MDSSYGFLFGVDYYPEHWPESDWEPDAELMKAAGFNVVRLAEFSWCRLEPLEGSYDFSWLDRAISLFGDHGIRVILGTPTATPPPWLTNRYPEVLSVDNRGYRTAIGGRRQYSASSSAYREHTVRIVTEMGKRYGTNRNVIGWQLDNEFGGDKLRGRCFSDETRGRFEQWLRENYGSLQSLNEAWGTVFWSQEYTDWSQIPVPYHNTTTHNPALVLDFYRFSSDNWVAYQQVQIDALKPLVVDQFITHNTMIRFSKIDYRRLATNLDIVSWDNYPRLLGPVDPAQDALGGDITRGLKRKGFIVMEQQSGPSGWEMVCVNPKPGEIRLWAYQAIAHGAVGVLFFRFATSRFGTEQYWHGILNHDRVPRERYFEVACMGKELKKFADAPQGKLECDIALIRSFDQDWAFEAQKNSAQFSYDEQIVRYYRALFNQNVCTDVLNADQLIAREYKLIIVPCHFLTTERFVDQLHEFARDGGTVILTFRSGIKDSYNTPFRQTIPGPFASLAGIEVHDYAALGGSYRQSEIHEQEILSETRGVQFVHHDFPRADARVDTWCDIITPTTAESIAIYTEDYFAGKSAVTMNRVGQGYVYYVGAGLNDVSLEMVVNHALRNANVKPVIVAPKNVEVVVWDSAAGKMVFLLNHNSEDRCVVLPTAARSVLTDELIEGEIHVAAHGVDILVLRETP